MFKRIVLSFVAVVAVLVLGLLAIAYRREIAPIDPPPASGFAAAVVARGEALAGAGYCANCHTAAGGARYAGGYAMVTPFGTLYSSNITPDADTGLGRWSPEAFRRAMHEGVSRDGRHLFPAFPYQHFNQVTDQDVDALYAFLMTRPAVHAPAREPDIAFPLNLRVLQAGWKLLYFRDNAYATAAEKSNSGKSEQWKRGAYLAEGIAHCSACHSPRNTLGAEVTDERRYAGAAIDGWYALPLSAANPAPVAWSEQELYDYLRNGATALHGSAAGPMSDVIHENGLAKVSDADVRAIAIYYADRMSTNATPGRNVDTARTAIAAATSRAEQKPRDHGAALYAAACASCHYGTATTAGLLRPDLGLSSALYASDPSTLIQIVLHGLRMDEGAPGVMMPGFAASFADADVADLAGWLRQSRAGLAPWPDLTAKVASVRAGPSK